VCCPKKPTWGLGHVLSDDDGTKVTVFFLGGGKRTLNTAIAELDLVTGPAAENPILDVAGQVIWEHAHHNLYVIELRSEIFEKERRFAEANPHWIGCSPRRFEVRSRRSWGFLRFCPVKCRHVYSK
jgi:hypothetical protein